jgi:IS30 family transposase
VSTISREVAANGGRNGYRAWAAHRRAAERVRRPKATKLSHQPLAETVTEWLERWWPPEEIAQRLPIEFSDDPMMRVSHETIYKSLFVQGRGELRRTDAGEAGGPSAGRVTAPRRGDRSRTR